jgi:neutral trehalase
MIVNEMHCLAKMADELGKENDGQKWTKSAEKLITLVNDRMWDEETGFFYHVDKKEHEFRFMERDLRRQEIIGFLPMWANAVSEERAAVLVKTLTDTNRFWRKYGVPTLSAQDAWYSPDVDYCCKWNGPVWLLWDYMVFEGLINYGYYELATELGDKMLFAVTTQLKKNHNFWESFSPDNSVLNCPSNYIWDSIMARVLIRMEEIRQQ